MNGKAKSQTHVEFEVLKTITEEIDLSGLRQSMATDKVAEKRFDKGAANVALLIQNMMVRRAHKLPKDHVDYEVKE